MTDLVDQGDRNGGTWPVGRGFSAGKCRCSVWAAVTAELWACVVLTLCRIHLQRCHVGHRGIPSVIGMGFVWVSFVHVALQILLL